MKFDSWDVIIPISVPKCEHCLGSYKILLSIKNKIMISSQILSLLLLVISCVHASNFTVSFYKCKGDTDVVTMDSATLTCEDSEYCTWGSSAVLSGAFTIQEDLLGSEGEVYSIAEVKTKAFGYKDLFEGDIDICDYAVGSLNDGEECPGAGTYSYSLDVTLPEEAKKRWYHKFIKKSYYGKNEIKFDFEDIDAKVKCKFKVHTEGGKTSKGKKRKSKKSSDDEEYDAENITGVAAVAVVGLAAAFGIKKRRRVVTAALSDKMLEDGRDEATSDFEMMDNKKDGTIMVHH